jgi:hypothetical protein
LLGSINWSRANRRFFNGPLPSSRAEAVWAVGPFEAKPINEQNHAEKWDHGYKEPPSRMVDIVKSAKEERVVWN